MSMPDRPSVLRVVGVTVATIAIGIDLLIQH
jgi:hypothetical protein